MAPTKYNPKTILSIEDTDRPGKRSKKTGAECLVKIGSASGQQRQNTNFFGGERWFAVCIPDLPFWFHQFLGLGLEATAGAWVLNTAL